MKQKIKIYDNGGKTLDRYTLVFLNRPNDRYSDFYKNKNYEALGFSENPYHPCGFGQHTSAQCGRHLGKLIKLDDLPEKAKKFALANMEGN